ncbi:MAG: C45 family peptidase [Cyclobacteriaceae bacterium]|nr:C45 family peptidase [Cyclobacteriaceae bacterium]
MKKVVKIVKHTLLIVVALLIVLFAVYVYDVRITLPEVGRSKLEGHQVKTIGVDRFQLDNNWLRKNEFGLWELYLEGEAYERGEAFGKLAYTLNEQKEAAFIDEIRNKVPSEGFLTFLKYLVGWINRDLDDYIPNEYLLEIYGSAQSMSDRFDHIGPKFHRILNYHAAHDIGHALQNMNLVGCTSFGVWNDQTDSATILIGRNFDFYFGQEFSKDKIVAFVNPAEGYKFMSVTWACFSGVVSGMNEKGLTVTLNSAKSPIPFKGKTPVSLIARQILQYASTIDEAYAIANTYESFVSETFLIGSKIDKRVGLIEKTQDKTELYFSDTSRMVVTNHFQSDALVNSKENISYREEGVSDYRYQRVNMMLDSIETIDVNDVVNILRDRNGLDGDKLGMGNEKAINQLIAHHSVIFSPNELKVWVSAAPYALGTYVGYDLNHIFNGNFNDSISIAADPFLSSTDYKKYELFMKVKEQIQVYLMTGGEPFLSESVIENFIASNPDSYLTYFYLGDYMRAIEAYESAVDYYQVGLTKNIARASEQQHMQEGLRYCIKKTQ